MKIVCIGGGSAMPKAVLRELKKKDYDLSVISATLDSGGSSGRLRERYNIIAVGDFRRALVELSQLNNKDIFNYRFENGHSLGNLVITYFLLNKYSIQEINDFFETQFKVFPATIENADLCAKLKNKEVVIGETNIDVPKHNSSIEEVFLNKKVSVFNSRIIEEAEVVILGPGDLYTSVIQNLLVEGVGDSIKRSNAKVLYICNLENKKGETDNFTVKDYVFEIERYLGKKIDCILYNNKNNEIEINNDLDKRFIGMNLRDKINFDKIL